MRYRLLLLLVVNVFCMPWAYAQKESLLVISSQRNAETIAEATELLAARYPQLKVQARSDEQLRRLTTEQLNALINASQAVLGVGIYGPSVAELFTHLSGSKVPVLMMNSDHRLVQLSRLQYPIFDNKEQVEQLSATAPEDDFEAWLKSQKAAYPKQADWLTARSYWQAGGSDNTHNLLAWYFNQLGKNTDYAAPAAVPLLRWFRLDKIQLANKQAPAQKLTWDTHIPAEFIAQAKPKSIVAFIDHTSSDRPADSALLRQLCVQLAHNNLQCLAALAYWGKAGVDAATALLPMADKLTAVVMLQDFVVGGGEGREQVDEVLAQLNVPVINAIKLRDRNAMEHHLSSDGLAQDKVYYQVAMPELQGASQPLIIAMAGEQSTDALTGLSLQPIAPSQEGIDALIARIKRWQILQTKNNRDKHVAIIYYNHPPGRHNIGADNLDVPASLWEILNNLKNAGYNTGTLPVSQAELLDLMQARGVNLPQDAGALAHMSQTITTMDSEQYIAWFKNLPVSVQHEMQSGPFGLLHEQIVAAINANKNALGQQALEHTMEEMHHLLEGVDHKGRARALALLAQLEACYVSALNEKSASPNEKSTTQKRECLDSADALIAALQQTGIEGLGGWGAPPGKVMTYQQKLLLPGLRFGNIFIGPQPPRGWEINEELLHANLAFPPPHQYLAFYAYLRNVFKADAMVHLGRHSTYEFLPRRSVGLASDDYSRIIAADIPSIYPYIVDGVGEGIQAKRRGLAVMIDHLTPPLKSTALYDELLQLRQLIESFEALHGSDNKAISQRLVTQIRAKVDSLELKDELASAMSGELAIMGIAFEEVDDDMLVHEIGHYLTNLQERFMPLGLHIYGKTWQPDAITMMLDSMAPENKSQRSEWQNNLNLSPKAEINALLSALAGGFIEPGQGNDPIRSPKSLPTGRNFYALDSSLIPSRAAWELGRTMAADARAKNNQSVDKSEALILWASDVVRDEGVMIALGLELLGLEPVWNSRGLVTGLKRQVLSAEQVRRNTVFTTSGLFRDLYGQQMVMLNNATLMALDASRDTIINDYPALGMTLAAALKPLGVLAQGGNENLQQNQVAGHWVKQARQLLANGMDANKAGIIASYRIFGDAPGSYGAGINRLVERSGAWEQREQLADVYMRRLGHSYGADGFGVPAQAAFKVALSDVENTYFGRASNLYGLLDNNDAFDYLGGLSLSVEMLTGQAPNNFVLNYADTHNINIQNLTVALRQELRARFLNPEWISGLMQHDYAGARTMGSEFIEYLWGWQVTNPSLVGDWAWEEVKAIYIDDRYQLNVDEFLQQGHNAHVKANILAVMLVAINKGFWHASNETTAQLAEQFSELVIANGLPGSGHTAPDHPMLPWLEQHIKPEQWQQLQKIINAAQGPQVNTTEVHRISELTLDTADNTPVKAGDSLNKTESKIDNKIDNQSPQAGDNTPLNSLLKYGILLIMFLFISTVAAGFIVSLRQAKGVPQ